MRSFVLCLILSCPALAETFVNPANGTSSSCFGAGACTTREFFSTEASNNTATGAVSFTSFFTAGNPPTSIKSISFSIAQCPGRANAGCTTICSGNFNLPANSVSATATAGCAGGAVTVGKFLRFQVAPPSPGATFDYQFDGPDTTTANTMLFCPTAGSTCACAGICNGNTCGNQFSAAFTDACSCDCTAAACVALSISGPPTFACKDSLDATHASCTWGAQPGGDPSTFYTQTVTNIPPSGVIYCSAPGITSCTDAPGVGVWTATVKASGSCTPTPLAGNTLTGKLTNNSSLTYQIQSRYAISISQ